MKQTLEQMNGAELAALVRKYIDAERVNDPVFRNIAFDVDGEHVIRTPEYVRVRVRPQVAPVRDGYLYGFLSDVNIHLMDDEGVNILLLADDAPDAVSGARELVAA